MKWNMTEMDSSEGNKYELEFDIILVIRLEDLGSYLEMSLNWVIMR